MKKILIITIIAIAALFIFKNYNQRKVLENLIPVLTEEEKTKIIETAGETKEDQTKYIENLEVSKSDSLDALEKELDETVILEEEFVNQE